MWSSQSEAGVAWTTPELIQSDPNEARQEPDLAIDPDGNGTVVWNQGPDGSFGIAANRFTAGVGWGDAERIDAALTEATDPRVGMDSAGNAVAVWRQVDAATCDVWSSRYTAGSGWGTPERISESARYCYLAEVAVGSSGDVVAVWTQVDRLWSNRYVPGAGWGEPERVDPDSRDDTEAVDLAVDAQGNAIVVMLQETLANHQYVWAAISSRPR